MNLLDEKLELYKKEVETLEKKNFNKLKEEFVGRYIETSFIVGKIKDITTNGPFFKESLRDVVLVISGIDRNGQRTSFDLLVNKVGFSLISEEEFMTATKEIFEEAIEKVKG
jgi:hypothetical protein